MRLIAIKLLACSIVLSFAAAACGDDADSDGTPTTNAGTGGSSAGGTGGTGGAYSGTVDPAECKTQTDKIATALPSGCSQCVCMQDAAMASSCDAACWGVFACTASKCAGLADAAAQTCAQSMCTAEISASVSSGSIGVILGIGMILQGSACGSVCDMSGLDAGI